MAAGRKGGKSLAKHAAVMRQLDGTMVDIGWFENARYPTGQSVAAVMIANEFGTTGGTDAEGNVKAAIPARPLLRQSAAVIDQKLPGYIERRQAEMLDGQVQPPTYLRKMGEALLETVLSTLKKGDFAPNADSTKKAKGFDKPLVDTSLLGQSISYRVNEGAPVANPSAGSLSPATKKPKMKRKTK